VEESEKSRRLTVLQELQRQIQVRRNSSLIGTVQEAMIEGFNSATGQWIGRTPQNRPLNFTGGGALEAGQYHRVLVTRAGPNSLVGEYAGAAAAA